VRDVSYDVSRKSFCIFPAISSESKECTMGASLRLCFVQHDKSRSVISSAVRNPAWMLRFVQHDRAVAFRTSFLPFRVFCVE
jgi:hypothetical protein